MLKHFAGSPALEVSHYGTHHVLSSSLQAFACRDDTLLSPTFGFTSFHRHITQFLHFMPIHSILYIFLYFLTNSANCFLKTIYCYSISVPVKVFFTGNLA